MKVKNIIINIILGVAVTVIIFNVIILIFGIRPYTVISPSMSPRIKVYTVVYVKHYKTEQLLEHLEIDDAITYSTSGGNTITHRIVEIDEERNIVITQGLDEKTMKEEIPIERIKGKVIFQIPLIGYVFQLFKNIYFLIILGLSIITGVVAYFLVKEIKKKKA